VAEIVAVFEAYFELSRALHIIGEADAVGAGGFELDL
jgi:hypothetical protein